MLKGIKTAVAIALSVGGLGTAVTLSAVAASPKEMQVAEASVSSGELFFVDVSAKPNWITDDSKAHIGVYFYNSGSDYAWASTATRTAYTGYIYQFTVPGNNKTWNYAIAVRLSNNVPNWNNKWNQTGDIELGSNNCIKVTDWNTGEAATYNGLDGGSQFYVNYNNANWWNTGSDQYMYFFDAQDGSGDVWQPMNEVHEARKTEGEGNDLILECTVPSSTKYYGAIAVRITEGETPSFDHAVQQSVDYKPITTGSINNAIVLGDGGYGQKATITSSYSIDSERRAVWYGLYFMSQTDGTCSSQTAPSTDTWKALSDEYNHMNSASRSLVKNADASKYEQGTANEYEEAARRYDLIVTLRGSGDFMSRNPSASGSARFNLVADDKKTTALIALIGCVVAVSITGLFFILRKKRKEQ